MGKAIVIFADGTGNARTARFRTNVWKMYAALDLSAGADQIAYYIDGVGTSAFAPLRLLGGIFGLGVKRNVRELYGFLCRNYVAGDRIYIFGFSRGAFTARVLAGLICRVGVLPIEDDAARAAWTREAMRRYRRQVEYRSRARLARAIAWVLAQVGDGWRALRRRLAPPRWDESGLVDGGVAMVGCWDTVSAYGGPITAMVRGWDQYVTPLSLPDYRLHPRVERARHALALDEEREAFLPLLWDECAPGADGRIRQVWFAGEHSDVGGGYPDRGLSAIPLHWMIEEAREAGLAFRHAAVDKIGRVADPTAPIHDSRAGVGAFYRYQPRRLSVLTGTRPSPLRDPVSGDGPMIERVVVDPSVLQRVAGGCDGYAPIVLPNRFEVGGHEWQLNLDGQRAVWRQVAYRRWLQFALLAVVTFALCSPLFAGIPLVDSLDHAWAPAVGGLIGIVPGVPGWAALAYGGSGVWLLLAGGLAMLTLRLADRRRLAIIAAARHSWRFDAEQRGRAPAEPARRRDRAQAVGRWWRWTALPAVFGALYYSVVAVAIFVCLDKAAVTLREREGMLCDPRAPGVSVIDVARPCQPIAGLSLVEGRRYRIRMIVPTGGAWRDGAVATDPTGFTMVSSVGQALGERKPPAPGEPLGKRKPLVERVGRALRRFAVHGLGVPMRRVLTARWFQPAIAVRPNASGGGPLDTSLLVRNAAVAMESTPDPRVFYGEVVAPASGRAYLFVNDATLPFADRGTDRFYTHDAGRNVGRACLAVQPITAPFREEDDVAARDCDARFGVRGRQR